MAASAQDALESIERRRAQLQHTVVQLRKALSHWTTLEAEYQLLKAEIDAAGNPSALAIRDIACALDSTLVDKCEIEELLGKNLPTKRPACVVVDLLSRRIDYVQLNCTSIEKQLDTAEKKLAGVDVLLEPGIQSEDGLPMMDIEEELDEEGNEISASLNQAGGGTADIIEALRKVGLQKAHLKKKDSDAHHTKEESLTNQSTLPRMTAPEANKELASNDLGLNPLLNTGVDSADATAVVYTEGKGHGAEGGLASDRHRRTADLSNATQALEADDGSKAALYPILPQNESPEDAELRRQMLQYGLSEVGQVVAELDLDYPTASYSDGDESYDETEDEESEDDYGRSTRRVMTEEYRERMAELEQSLSTRMPKSVGPQPDPQSLLEHTNHVHAMHMQTGDHRLGQSFDNSELKAASAKPEGEPLRKSVRFAVGTTLSEPAKVSRFKSERTVSKQLASLLPTLPVPVPLATQTPSGPPGRTLANTITEHASSSFKPVAPDDFDPIALNHELQTEYHKARNKFIQQQGGFNSNAQNEGDQMIEKHGGTMRKVSRFKAARLRADGL